MPEAPEVQVVLDTLQTQIQGCQIKKVDVFYDKLVEFGDIQNLVGELILDFHRIGKYLILETNQYDWVIHLRMEGKFYIYDQLPENLKHIHAIFQLNDQRYLCFHDVRKFGRMWIQNKVEDLYQLNALKNVGYDYTDERVDGMYLYQHIHSSTRPLKAALLDQSIVAGIGNIYANEICFACGLDPRSRCQRISKKDCENLIYETRRILTGATRFGGTTIRSYTSSLGVTGRFQLKLKVHARQGEPCPMCGQPIKKIKVDNRGTYLCQHCQKRK